MITDEQAKWSMVVSQATAKYRKNVADTLADTAARGFRLPAGSALEQMLLAGQEIKQTLVDENGKIFVAQLDNITALQDAMDRYLLELAKLELLRYKARWLDKIEQENRKYEDLVEKNKGDLISKEALIESRMAAIIYQQAELKMQLNCLKTEHATINLEVYTVEKQLAEMRKAYAIEQMALLDPLRLEAENDLAAVQYEQARQVVQAQVIGKKLEAANAKQAMDDPLRHKIAAQYASVPIIADEQLAEETKKVLALLLEYDKSVQEAFLRDDKYQHHLKEEWNNVDYGTKGTRVAEHSKHEMSAELTVERAETELEIKQAISDARAEIASLERQLKISLPSSKRLLDLTADKAMAQAEGDIYESSLGGSATTIESDGLQTAQVIISSAVTERNTTYNREEKGTSTVNSMVTLQRKISKG